MVGREPAQRLFQTAHCDDVYKRTDTHSQEWHDHQALEHLHQATPMWSIIVLFIAGAALLIASRFRVPGGVNPAHLGWMSAQWLADYRASQRM
jgi:hypothetical protein